MQRFSVSVMADPNWLLSAIAQSTAALVAIVGGLVVSRLISLSSEGSALLRRRTMLAGRLADARQEARAGRAELVADDVGSGAIEEWVRALAESDGELSIDDLLEVASPGHWLPDDYRPHIDALLRVYGEAIGALESLDDVSFASLPATVEEMARHVDVPEYDEERSIWQQLLDIYRQRRRQLADRNWTNLQERTGLRLRRPTTGRFEPLPDVSVPVIPPEYVVLDAQRRERAERDYSETEAEVRRLEHELSVVDDAFSDVQQPPGIWIGFGILTGFALLGIVFPFVLMAGAPERLHLGWRLVVVIAFVAGLGALLAYIGWFIRQLGQDYLDRVRA